MRRVRLAGSIGLALLVACGPEGEKPPGNTGSGAVPSQQDTLASAGGGGPAEGARAVVRGVVRDAGTDRPLEEALVSARELGTATDDAGVFVLPMLPPGETGLEVYRRGFLAESVFVVLEPGASASIAVALEPAPPACCSLAGEWVASFDLDSAGLNARPTTRNLEGRIRFPAASRDGDDVPPRISDASGTTDMNFGPLLGGDVDAGVDEVQGAVFHGDSAALTMLPRFGDWALELRGRVGGDTVRGDWYQRASCCGAYGRFLLVRDADASSASSR